MTSGASPRPPPMAAKDELFSMFVFLGGRLESSETPHTSLASASTSTSTLLESTQAHPPVTSSTDEIPGLDMYIFLGGKVVSESQTSNNAVVKVETAAAEEGEEREEEEDKEEEEDSDWDDFGDFQAGDDPGEENLSATADEDLRENPDRKVAQPNQDQEKDDEDFGDFANFDHFEERDSVRQILLQDAAALRVAFRSIEEPAEQAAVQPAPFNDLLSRNHFGPAICKTCNAFLPIAGSACSVCGARPSIGLKVGVAAEDGDSDKAFRDIAAKVGELGKCVTGRRDLTSGLDEGEVLGDFVPSADVELQHYRRSKKAPVKQFGRPDGEEVARAFEKQEGTPAARAATNSASVEQVHLSSAPENSNSDTEEPETEEEEEVDLEVEEDEGEEPGAAALDVGDDGDIDAVFGLGDLGKAGDQSAKTNTMANDPRTGSQGISGGFASGEFEHAGEVDEFTEFSSANVVAQEATVENGVGNRTGLEADTPLFNFAIPNNNLNGVHTENNKKSADADGDLLAMTLEGLGLSSPTETKSPTNAESGAKECTVFERAEHIRNAKNRLAELFDGDKPPDLAFMQAKTVCVPKQTVNPALQKASNTNTDDPFLDLLS